MYTLLQGSFTAVGGSSTTADTTIPICAQGPVNNAGVASKLAPMFGCFDKIELWITNAVPTGSPGTPTLAAKLQVGPDAVHFLDSGAAVTGITGTATVKAGSCVMGVASQFTGIYGQIVLTAGSASGTATYTGTWYLKLTGPAGD